MNRPALRRTVEKSRGKKKGEKKRGGRDRILGGVYDIR